MANILLADDDANIRELVHRALKADGHSVIVTEDGAAAVEALQTSPFDLVVSDVDMPQLDGIEVGQAALKLKPNIRIVLMSGHTDQLERAKKLSSAHVSSISKPFSLEQIKATVRKALD